MFMSGHRSSLFLLESRPSLFSYCCERSSASIPTNFVGVIATDPTQMVLVDLREVPAPLPLAVRRLQGMVMETMPTAGDGACAIHSVWGEWECGELFKRDARSFLFEAFGPTAEIFKSRLSSEELLGDMELGLWDLIQPIAKQSDPFGAPLHAGGNEGQHVWHCLLASSFDVAQRCVGAGRR